MILTRFRFRDRVRSPAFRPWFEELHADPARSSRMRRGARLLDVLVPAGPYFPDFLTPYEGLLGLDSGLAALLRTPHPATGRRAAPARPPPAPARVGAPHRPGQRADAPGDGSRAARLLRGGRRPVQGTRRLRHRRRPRLPGPRPAPGRGRGAVRRVRAAHELDAARFWRPSTSSTGTWCSAGAAFGWCRRTSASGRP
ncbi:hypothetical protein ACFSTC_40390 [Nonomuraea ferruginea]